MASSTSSCRAADTPAGLLRFRIGSPTPRNGTPWYAVGKKPLPQLRAPPRGPRGPDCSTTNPGSDCDSLPTPYVTHEPIDGRPNCGEPVLTKIFAGAWLK